VAKIVDLKNVAVVDLAAMLLPITMLRKNPTIKVPLLSFVCACSLCDARASNPGKEPSLNRRCWRCSMVRVTLLGAAVTLSRTRQDGACCYSLVDWNDVNTALQELLSINGQ